LYTGFEVSTSVVMKSVSFWDITPCSPLSVNRRFGGTYHLLACWFLAELIPSTLKMKAIFSSETSVYTQHTTRRYIPEADTLKSNTVFSLNFASNDL
jgi:hypothetical protein